MSSDRVTLEVTERDAEQLGSRRVRRLRKDGLVPGVLYGKGHARAIVVGERDLRAALTGRSGLHAIIDVVIEGQTTPHHAVLKDFQRHPIRGTLTHVDFHEVRLDRPIQATVNVQFVGESPGAKQGGVVQQVTRELRVEALPTGIPEHIEADISALEVGDTVRVADLEAIEGVAFLDDPETVLANCSIPRGITELEEAEAAEGEEGEEGEAAAEGEGGETSAEAPARAPTPTPSEPCASSAGERAGRRWIFSSQVSATPGLSTRTTGTTSAGWSSTSSRAGTRIVQGEVPRQARRRSPGGGEARPPEAGDVHERVGSVDPGGRGLLQDTARQLLVVHDDVDLETARLQARLGGGLAGHNGLRSIAQRLGAPDFLRLRVGVGRPGRGDPRPIADYVLSSFAPEDDVEAIVARASDAVEALVRDGLEETQRRFN